MTSIYYAKTLIHYKKKHCRNVMICVKTYGVNIEDAKFNLSQLINSWDDIRNYEVLKIGKYPIPINRYIVAGTIKMFSGEARQIRLTVTAENKDEAKTMFKKIIESWKGLVSHEITQVVAA